MLCELDETRPTCRDDVRFVNLIAMLEHVLDHIVAILILRELLTVRMQFIEQRAPLFIHAMLEDTLNYSTPIRVSRQIVHLFHMVRLHSSIHSDNMLQL